MSRERNDRGQFVGVDDEAVLEAVRDAGRVATARDVAERLDCTREAAYQRLSALHDRGVADRRKVGGRAVVWWVSEGEGRDTSQGSAAPLDRLVGTLDGKAVDRVRERAGEFRESVDESVAETHTDRSDGAE